MAERAELDAGGGGAIAFQVWIHIFRLVDGKFWRVVAGGEALEAVLKAEICAVYGAEFLVFDRSEIQRVPYSAHQWRVEPDACWGVDPWTFEQNLGESVFIPAGCPHQVRNLKFCIKVAIDFVTPENYRECIQLT